MQPLSERVMHLIVLIILLQVTRPATDHNVPVIAGKAYNAMLKKSYSAFVETISSAIGLVTEENRFDTEWNIIFR